MRKRGFEITTAYQEKMIHLPIRATKGAAGYDFEAAEDIVVPSVWQAGVVSVIKYLLNEKSSSETDLEMASQKIKPILVPTGIKAYMGADEYLELCNRSSNPLKNHLILANGVGIIDSDYYNNEANEGHIMFQFLNFSFLDKRIKKGERIGQGIFHSFLKADEDKNHGDRVGGFGSSGK